MPQTTTTTNPNPVGPSFHLRRSDPDPITLVHAPNPCPNFARAPPRTRQRNLRFLADTFPRENEPSRVRCTLLSVVGSILDSDIPHGILSSLRRQTKGHTGLGQTSEKLSVALSGHSKAVNVVQWSTNHGEFSYRVKELILGVWD
ncbi:hypothetical protein RHGRI_009540 [Rhododendron griersonianum]|uniref:Uncharacterized protein n=1 Tax=Rhododendron griersonianum TaxID=479676 RepID=A0AAV6KFV0_9ERIC|nr:hypothetical protein RHGRI_009540 [Rhododendron griersonianum]